MTATTAKKLATARRATLEAGELLAAIRRAHGKFFSVTEHRAIRSLEAKCKQIAGEIRHEKDQNGRNNTAVTD